MNSTTPGIRAINLPANDGAIASALADLNAKLSRWSAAMTRPHAGSASCTSPVPSESQMHAFLAAAEPVVHADHSVAAPSQTASLETPPAHVEVPPDPVTGESGEQVHDSLAASFFGIVEPATAIHDTGEADESDLWRRAEQIARSGSAHRQAHALNVPVDIPDAHASADDEVERLLATLDPELANAVRIQRRLTGGDVHELIEQLQQRPHHAPAMAPVKRTLRSWLKWGQT